MPVPSPGPPVDLGHTFIEYQRWRVAHGLPPLAPAHTPRHTVSLYLSHESLDGLTALAHRLGYASSSAFLEALGQLHTTLFEVEIRSES